MYGYHANQTPQERMGQQHIHSENSTKQTHLVSPIPSCPSSPRPQENTARPDALPVPRPMKLELRPAVWADPLPAPAAPPPPPVAMPPLPTKEGRALDDSLRVHPAATEAEGPPELESERSPLMFSRGHHYLFLLRLLLGTINNLNKCFRSKPVNNVSQECYHRTVTPKLSSNGRLKSRRPKWEGDYETYNHTSPTPEHKAGGQWPVNQNRIE